MLDMPMDWISRLDVFVFFSVATGVPPLREKSEGLVGLLQRQDRFQDVSIQFRVIPVTLRFPFERDPL